MFFFDAPLYALLNAAADTPAWRIALASLLSEWVPDTAGLALLAGFIWGNSAVRRSLGLLVLSMVVAWCITRLIRWGFPTLRPYDLDIGIRWIEHSGRSSFPSMHATGAFALAQAITLGATRHYRLWVGLAWTAAAVLGLSRIYLGVHFPSDVLAGMAVGCLSAWMVFAIHRNLQRQRGLAANAS